MTDREAVAKWFEFDYLPRVGAYRKDCKIGCDACIPKHDGDNYCDIDMLSKALALLKEQPEIVRCRNCRWYDEKISFCDNCNLPREQTFFCADGERESEDV